MQPCLDGYLNISQKGLVVCLYDLCLALRSNLYHLKIFIPTSVLKIRLVVSLASDWLSLIRKSVPQFNLQLS